MLKYVNSSLLLSAFGVGAALCSIGAIAIHGMVGLYFLIGISLFMSIMFPCIYGIALQQVDSHDTPFGAAFLVMAIVGGALLPPLQGMIIDQELIMGYPAVNWSYSLPFLCFLVVIIYGYMSFRKLRV